MTDQFKLQNYLLNLGLSILPYGGRTYRKIGTKNSNVFYFVGNGRVKFGQSTKSAKDVTNKLMENVQKWEVLRRAS